jgi:hypothetical protein
MTAVKPHQWHSLCLKALLEPLDSPHLSRFVKEAEKAIFQRLQELRVSANGGGEREAIEEALLSLRNLKNKKLRHLTVVKTEQLRQE